MTLAALIDALSQPTAYPFAVSAVEIHHTHLSVVFLAGAFAYKVKKPVQLGFVDFGNLGKRRWFCREEVRLNRRLAPSVYLGVVPIVRGADGVRVEGQGEVMEWAVKMVRLPFEASLEQRVNEGETHESTVAGLASRLAAFHAEADTSPEIAESGGFAVVARNFRDNFDQSRTHIGVTVSPDVHARLVELTEGHLLDLRPLIERRALAGKPRDTHGDLRLEHIYFFPQEPPPGDLVIIDCIEFNERYRFADPIADMAFLVMDLLFHGKSALANTFAKVYFQASGDEEGRALLPFYTAYRAAVRAKVEGMENEEAEVPSEERLRVCKKAQAHWLLALGQLEKPRKKPVLILVGGLPGSGKSTLARALAQTAGVEVIRSDVVRKEMSASAGTAALNLGVRGYTPEATRLVYEECLRRAEAMLFQGKRVLVDATFRANDRRRAFLEAARRWAVPAVFLVCQTDAELVRRRLAGRRGDESDADWSVYVDMEGEWDRPSPEITPMFVVNGDEGDRTLLQALNALTSCAVY